VTVTFCGSAPAADTVNVAIRLTATVFAAAVTVTVPLPVPVAGVTVIQAWSLAIVHDALETTFIEALLPAAGPTVSVTGLTEREVAAGDCVTITTWEAIPAADTVTRAPRAAVTGLAEAVRTIVPFPFPDPGLTVSQD
jgi:hypothetical protein